MRVGSSRDLLFVCPKSDEMQRDHLPVNHTTCTFSFTMPAATYVRHCVTDSSFQAAHFRAKRRYNF